MIVKEKRDYPWKAAQTIATIGCLFALTVIAFEVRDLRRDIATIVDVIERPRPTRWEYAIRTPSDATFSEEMTTLGKAGWEIVSARRALDTLTDSAAYEVILRRPAPPIVRADAATTAP